MQPDQPPRYALSDDRMTLVVQHRIPGAVRTVTLHRQPQAGPFTDADVAAVLAWEPSPGWQVGQRNRTRRWETRYGTLWSHLMTGPPTWWLPKARLEKDGTVMAGWLRLGVAVRFSRPSQEASHAA